MNAENKTRSLITPLDRLLSYKLAREVSNEEIAQASGACPTWVGDTGDIVTQGEYFPQ